MEQPNIESGVEKNETRLVIPSEEGYWTLDKAYSLKADLAETLTSFGIPTEAYNTHKEEDVTRFMMDMRMVGDALEKYEKDHPDFHGKFSEYRDG